MSYQEIIEAELRLIPVKTEREQIMLEDALKWVASTSALCRTKKPDVPNKHLVAYFVVHHKHKVLLVAHKLAGLWLPTGGHVDVGEHPRDCARRELNEELGIEYNKPIGPPVSLSITTTVGKTAGHTDVSLWYKIDIDQPDLIQFDGSEFEEIAWYTYDQLPLAESDPYLAQYAEKIIGFNPVL